MSEGTPPQTGAGSREGAPGATGLLRRLGLFDATMAVIGGIVGAGIFMNPAVVARLVPSGPWIMAAWILGGMVALFGAWIYAELGSERPATGGQYAYFREALHPAVAFMYGWGLLWVIQSGGMAAVGVTFAKYLGPLIGWTGDDRWLAASALLVLTVVNCIGVRAGASTQNLFTVLKGFAIAGLIVAGFFFVAAPSSAGGAAAGAMPVAGVAGRADAAGLLSAMVPVLFAYGGWQTACFLAGEVREPARTLPRALVLGIAAVIVLYLATSTACLRALGVAGLGGTSTPASDVMQRAFGETGAKVIALGIVVSTFGFLSQGMLTTPRLYYAMARDRLFFAGLGEVHPRTGTPMAAVILTGAAATLIAFSGSYDMILNYVVSVDFIFYGLAGTCVFLFRRRPGSQAAFRVPGHPWTTLIFIGVCWATVVNLAWVKPGDAFKGFGILATGLPVYAIWRARAGGRGVPTAGSVSNGRPRA